MNRWIIFLSGLALVMLATTGGNAARAAGSTPPKAYVIAEIQVADPEAYRAYVAKISPVVKRFGGIYLARAGRTESVEGSPPAGRVVVIEFPSFAAAQTFEKDPEHLAVAAMRQRAASSRVFIVEGAAP